MRSRWTERLKDEVAQAVAVAVKDTRIYYLQPPMIMFGLILPGLIGGSVIIESIFSWPGMGRMAYEAILARDYPIILTVNFISAVLVLIGTFISDLLFMLVDPRIRL